MTREGRSFYRCAVLILCTAVLVLPSGVQAARSSRSLKPTEFREALTLAIEGKQRSYWSFTGEEPLVFTARGPGRVKLITRLAIAAGETRGKYGLVVWEGDAEVARTSYEVLTAASVAGGGAPAWGRHRNLYFDVPAGRHTYQVELTGDGQRIVAARPRFLRPRPPRRRVSITPATYERVLTLIRSEKEITYYHLTPDVPLALTLVGPAVLQVNTRLDFDRHMKGGSHSYTVAVLEAGATLGQATFEVTRSQVASYRNKLEVVPGVVKSFKVTLPSGPHELEIRLDDTVASGAGAKLYLPAEDVN